METVDNPDGPLLNEFEVAQKLRVSVSTVRRWRHLKRGPRYLKLNATIRYKTEDVTAWISSMPTGAGAGFDAD